MPVSALNTLALVVAPLGTCPKCQGRGVWPLCWKPAITESQGFGGGLQGHCGAITGQNHSRNRMARGLGNVEVVSAHGGDGCLLVSVGFGRIGHLRAVRSEFLASKQAG